MRVAVINQKGGVGKTTIATNVAAAAHLHGRKTLILDLDHEQGSSVDWFRSRPDESALEGLNVLSSPIVTPKKLASLTHGYDWVVFDLPARLGAVSQAAAVTADVLIVPFRPGAFDWWAGDRTFDVLEQADAERERADQPPAARLYVLNAMRPNINEHRIALDALRALGGLGTFTLGDRVAYSASARRGRSVFEEIPADSNDPSFHKGMAPDPHAVTEITAIWKLLEQQEAKAAA